MSVTLYYFSLCITHKTSHSLHCSFGIYSLLNPSFLVVYYRYLWIMHPTKLPMIPYTALMVFIG